MKCYLCEQEGASITVEILARPELNHYVLVHQDCLDEFLNTLVVYGGYAMSDATSVTRLKEKAEVNGEI